MSPCFRNRFGLQSFFNALREMFGRRTQNVTLITLSLGCILCGCKSVSTTHPEHLVAIDPDGGLHPLKSSTTQPGRHYLVKNPAPKHMSETNTYFANSYGQINRIFQTNSVLDGKDNILLFIQGGLNDLKSGADRATSLSDTILKDGSYPLFLAWDASLFSAWAEQYTTHRGRNAPVVGGVLAPFTFLANAGRLATRLPLSAYEQGDAGIHTMNARSYGSPEPGVSANSSRAAAVNLQYDHLKHAGFDVDLNPSTNTAALYGRGFGMVASAAPKIVGEGVVETGGKVGWDFMLRRTKTMFTVANSFAPGGMDYFARELGKYLKAHPTKKVTIVAHSMGAIVANELIRRYGDDLHIANLVYMAAACSVESMDKVIIPFLNGHPAAQFYNLCLHPANDYSEIAYPVSELIAPRGSLLDWIDHYYSSTETDYGWTLGKWDNVILASKSFLGHANAKKLETQIHIKAFGFGPEAEFGPQHHGGFGQMKFWDENFWKKGPFDPSWRQ